MFLRPNPNSGVPIYLQLMEQVKHAVETGALRPGEQLPGMRKVAEDLVMNPNTVAKAYRELEHEGVIELRHGSGAFVSDSFLSNSRLATQRKALPVVHAAVEKLRALGLSDEEIRRIFESALRGSSDVRSSNRSQRNS